MKTLTANDAKCGFGPLIEFARAEPVVVAKHGRPVIVMRAVEEFGSAEGAGRAGNSSGARKKAKE
jgi:prevent-host-death family protein